MVPDSGALVAIPRDVGEPPAVLVPLDAAIEAVRETVRQILPSFHIPDPNLDFVGASLPDGVHQIAVVRGGFTQVHGHPLTRIEVRRVENDLVLTLRRRLRRVRILGEGTPIYSVVWLTPPPA